MLTELKVPLPYRPIWIGLAANSLVFAVLWCFTLVAARAPSRLRRHHRLRRNHCPRCNYDLRATPPNSPCPECGARAAARTIPA